MFWWLVATSVQIKQFTSHQLIKFWALFRAKRLAFAVENSTFCVECKSALMDFAPQIPCGASRRVLRWLGHLVDQLSLINKARNPVTKRSKLPAI